MDIFNKLVKFCYENDLWFSIKSDFGTDRITVIIGGAGKGELTESKRAPDLEVGINDVINQYLNKLKLRIMNTL